MPAVQNYEYIQPTVNNIPKTKEFDIDVVNEYLYKKTKKKRDISLAEKSIENTNQINAQLNGKFNMSQALRNHQHRTETDNDV